MSWDSNLGCLKHKKCQSAAHKGMRGLTPVVIFNAMPRKAACKWTEGAI